MKKQFTKKIAETICTRIVNGESLSTICQDKDLPSVATVYKWLRESADFSRDYNAAKRDRADFFAEQLNELPNTLEKELRSTNLDNKAAHALVQVYRLKSDNLKWVASKHYPHVYGDRVNQPEDTQQLPTTKAEYDALLDKIKEALEKRGKGLQDKNVSKVVSIVDK